MKVLLLSIFLIISGCGSSVNDDTAPNDPTGEPSQVKIGSFNVQIFGRSFMENDDRVFYLREIIKRYDIMLLQEIRDSSGESVTTLKNPLSNYKLAVSPRLGRTSSKEQYAFFFNSEKIALEQCSQDDDPNDDFEREPYTCVFRDIKSGKKFGLMALHVKPTDAQNELIAVESLYNNLKVFLNAPLVLLGDLNADCSYLSESEYNNLPLASYTWLLPQEADTTTSSTDCAYDNIIVDENLASESILPQVFDFQAHFSLSTALTQDISDHYPIEFTLNFASQE